MIIVKYIFFSLVEAVSQKEICTSQNDDSVDEGGTNGVNQETIFDETTFWVPYIFLETGINPFPNH